MISRVKHGFACDRKRTDKNRLRAPKPLAAPLPRVLPAENAGHMGTNKKTILNLKVIEVKQGVVLIGGSVPGKPKPKVQMKTLKFMADVLKYTIQMKRGRRGRRRFLSSAWNGSNASGFQIYCRQYENRCAYKPRRSPWWWNKTMEAKRHRTRPAWFHPFSVMETRRHHFWSAQYYYLCSKSE